MTRETSQDFLHDALKIVGDVADNRDNLRRLRQQVRSSWDDAQYYIGYLQHAIDWLKTGARFSSLEDKKSSIEVFEQGKALYEQRAREAKQS